MKKVVLAISVLGLGLVSAVTVAETKFRGLLQSQIAIAADDEASYLERGTGLLRYDDDNRFDLAHAMLEIKSELGNNFSLHGILNHTIRPKPFTNITQLSLKYKPIWSAKYRYQFRAGMFYPEMGFENPDIGWLSPYAYTNSAINSWIGEELRAIGGEVKITRPGRAHGGSPHTFALVGSIYKGNDPTGTILAWRGWGLHDKQSLLNETIFFARYPSIGPGEELDPQAAWVEPFREIDGRFGYYAGIHWDYQKKSRVRYYYYNNNADETILARRGQYAWHTLFHNISWQYRFNKEWRLLAQYMDGNTAMGPGAVNVDFNSWFAMLSYKKGPHRTSFRYDDFETIDQDRLIPEDDNNGDGYGFTIAYRYNINKNIQIGTEFVYVDSFQANRAQWPARETDISQSQLLGVVQLRF